MSQFLALVLLQVVARIADLHVLAILRAWNALLKWSLAAARDRIAVAEFRSHMHGTTVSVDKSGMVASFSVGGLDGPRLPNKTINIYSLSMGTWHEVTRRLELRIAAGRVHDYYESVFGEMAAHGVLPLRAVWFDDGRWSEIDTPGDLLAAQNLFYGPEFAKGA